MKYLQITCIMNVNPISFFQQKLAGIQPKQDLLPTFQQSGTEPNTTGEGAVNYRLLNCSLLWVCQLSALY